MVVSEFPSRCVGWNGFAVNLRRCFSKKASKTARFEAGAKGENVVKYPSRFSPFPFHSAHFSRWFFHKFSTFRLAREVFDMRHSSSFSRFPVARAMVCGALGLVLVASGARGDAFSAIAASDPIYSQLSALSPANAKVRPATGLTRYEAALQVARVVTTLDEKSRLSRASWRALRNLTTALKSELRQLGLNVEKTLALCEEKLTIAPDETKSGLELGSKARPVAAPQLGLQTGAPLKPVTSSRDEGVVGLNWRLSPKLSGQTQFSTADKAAPFQTAAPRGNDFEIGRSSSMAFDLNSWLRLRASSAQRRLGLPDQTPALSAPLFEGAREAFGVGGGVDVALTDNLRVSTDLESLSTDTGRRGTRVGGGVELSTFRNRLNLTANFSRLTPESAASLPTTTAQVGVGVGVGSKLSLNLFYQGLFSEERARNASRIGGGASVSF